MDPFVFRIMIMVCIPHVAFLKETVNIEQLHQRSTGGDDENEHSNDDEQQSNKEKHDVYH